MGDGPLKRGKGDPKAGSTPAGKQSEGGDHSKPDVVEPLQQQFQDLLGKGWKVLSGQGEEPARSKPAPAGESSSAQGQHASDPFKEFKEWVTNPVHKWDQSLMQSSGNSADQVVAKLKPEVALSIDHGRQVSEALSGGRSAASLSAAEKQDLQNYKQFQETLKAVPLVDQNDVKRSVEEALHQRAEQLKQNPAAGPSPEVARATSAPPQKGESPERPGAAGSDRGAQPAYLAPEKNILEQTVAGGGHLYNDLLGNVTGQNPKQIVDKLDPQAAVLINSGRELQQAIDNGRYEGSLNTRERQDLDAYKKFQETLKAVPGFEQNALRGDMEAAIRQKAEQYQRTQTAERQAGPPAKSDGNERTQTARPGDGPKSEGSGTARPADRSNQPDGRADQNRTGGARQPVEPGGQEPTRRAGGAVDPRQQDSRAGSGSRVDDRAGSRDNLDVKEARTQQDRQLKPFQGETAAQQSARLLAEGKTGQAAAGDRQAGLRPPPDKGGGDRLPESKIKGEAPAAGKASNVEGAAGRLADAGRAKEKETQSRPAGDRNAVEQYLSRKAQAAPEAGSAKFSDKGRLTGAGDGARDFPGRTAGGASGREAAGRGEPGRAGEQAKGLTDKERISGAARPAGRGEAGSGSELKRPGGGGALNVADLARGIKSLPDSARAAATTGDARGKAAPATSVFKGPTDLAKPLQRLEGLIPQ